MASPVDHIVGAFRGQFSSKIAQSARSAPIALIVQQHLLPVMRKLTDDSESRSRLSSRTTPAFPCVLQKRTVLETPTGNKSVISNKTNVALWNSVLPWETSLGLSHVNLHEFQLKQEDEQVNDNNKDEKSEKVTSSSSSLTKLPHGMLFISRGIAEATSDLNGTFVRNSSLNFWSGAIREPIDVLFLQSKKPLPKKVTYLGRKGGDLADALLDPFCNSYETSVEDVVKLDPFPQSEKKSTKKREQPKMEEEEKTVGEDQKKERVETASPSALQSMFSFLGVNRSDSSSNSEDASSTRSLSASNNTRANKGAPFFVLELPEGFVKENIVNNEKKTDTTINNSGNKYDRKQEFVELVLGEEIAVDIDQKMVISNTILPTFVSATNTILHRMCTDVLQRGAKYVRTQRKKKDEKPFGKTSSEDNNDDEDEHLWTDTDTEFLCLATRLAVADYELTVATWECLADYIQREEDAYSKATRGNNNEERACSGFFDLALRSKENPDEEPIPVRAKSFEMISELMNDGSVVLPHSVVHVLNTVKAKE